MLKQWPWRCLPALVAPGGRGIFPHPRDESTERIADNKLRGGKACLRSRARSGAPVVALTIVAASIGPPIAVRLTQRHPLAARAVDLLSGG